MGAERYRLVICEWLTPCQPETFEVEVLGCSQTRIGRYAAKQTL